MAGCHFGSPDLVTSISGTAATPTFAFDATNANYFGLSGSFTSNNGAVCSFPTRSVGSGITSTYAITPIIVTTSGLTGRTTACGVLAPSSIVSSSGGSTTYSGVDCPSATNSRFAPGTYTLRFSQPNVNGVPTISSRLFVVASPTFVTDYTTASVLQTATASAVTFSTTTVTEYTSTVTETQNASTGQTITTTVPGSASTTSTLTDFVQSCASSASTLFSSPSSSEISTLLSIVSSTSSTPASSTSSTSTPTASLVVSLDGQCGGQTGQTCLGSEFGSCCSSYGYCGSTDLYCQATEGCQVGFGNCIAPSPVSSSALPTSTIKVSIDGSCGGDNGFVCAGSGFGDCCSPYGWCGSTTAHCGAGCQFLFGTCNSSPTTLATVTGTALPPSSTLKVSLDGACGGTTGQTCLGSDFGNCCSEYGYCGSTEIYCSTGCQPTFGQCPAAVKLKRSPELSPQLVPFAAAKRAEKRAIGGVGPDYTYPPVPHTTITTGITQFVTVTPSAGVETSTVFANTTTTLEISSTNVVTVTSGPTETVRVTSTVCVAPV